jgi:DNA modification methylase
MLDILAGDPWKIYDGDCIAHMHDLPRECMDVAMFSPPFPSTFAYTSLVEDIGNSEELQNEVKLHFSFFFKALRRVMKPGRVVVVHCAQIGRLKRAGEEGLFDFRGLLIRLAQRAGFIYEYDWLIRKNPQAQAIRTRKWEIKFQGLEADRSISRGALPDYLLKFRTPGEIAVKINSKGQVSRNDWIKWAESCWDDIIETDTLNVAEGRGEDDTKHICPLQLEIYRRLILLYTNPDEIVFEPFGGIGSGGFVCRGGKSPKTKKQLTDQRRYYCCEIKEEYIAANHRNLARAEEQYTNANEVCLPGFNL